MNKRFIKYLVPLLLVLLSSACGMRTLQLKGGHVQNLGQVAATEVVLVGSVEFIPPLKDEERDFSRIKSKTFIDAHEKLFWLVKGDRWLKTRDYDVYDKFGGMTTDFVHHTPVPHNNDLFYITTDRNRPLHVSGGYLPYGVKRATRKITTHTNVGTDTRLEMEFIPNSKHMDFKLNIDTFKAAKAIYIGDIKIYRDRFMNLKKVVVEDNYTRANQAFKQTFKVKENLAKALAHS